MLLAASRADPGLSLDQLLHQVEVTVAPSNLLAITVSAKTAADAQGAANAVARCYVAFVRSLGAPGGQVPAKLVCRPGSAGLCASPATGTTVTAWAAELAGLGALAGVVLGTIVVVAIGRNGRGPRALPA